MPNKIYLGFLLFFFYTPQMPLSADVIKLNSGQHIEGKVLKETKDSILVDAGIDTPVTYFRDEIKEIIPTVAVSQEEKPISPQARLDADAKEAKAVELIDEGKMGEGLAQLQEAINLDPVPQRHFNYGSILFGNGVAAFKKGQIQEAKKTLAQAQLELEKAIKGFNPNDDKQTIAQAYFLLGQMQDKAYGDPDKARTYYQKSLSIGDHPGAKAALAQLDQK